MKINKKDFLNIKTLLIEGVITAGKFDNKEIIVKLLLNGSINKERQTPKREIIHLLKFENIFIFLKNYNYNIYRVEDIDCYIEEVIDNRPSRDIIQKWQQNTKATKSDSLKGLYLSSLTTITIKLNGEELSLLPTNGLGYFLFHTEVVELSEDTIVVGIENYQVVWFAEKYSEFFHKKNILFVVINPYMLEWIENLKNEYIHFGDYDLAGINIYLNRIVPRLKECKKHSMFIPKNIEYLIKKHGDRELYEQQILYKNLVINDTKVSELKDIICHYKKSLEQEGLYLL